MEEALKFTKFAQWLKSDLGRYYLHCEQEELNDVLPHIYGYYLVQAGIIDNYNLKSMSTINHHIYIGRILEQKSSSLQIEASLNELPFQFESIDAFFLPHTLEFCQSPRKLLNEIYNILIPGGKIIILGFNPFSLFGLSNMLKNRKDSYFDGQMQGLGRVKNHLLSAGFSVDFSKYFCSSLNMKNKIIRGFPALGSIYIIIAQKKVIPLSPMKLKVYKKKIPVPRGFPEPSTNKGGI